MDEAFRRAPEDHDEDILPLSAPLKPNEESTDASDETPKEVKEKDKEVEPSSRVKLNHLVSQVIGDVKYPVKTEREIRNENPPPTVSNAQPAGTNQDGQMISSSNVQPQISTQTLQPSAAAPFRFRWNPILRLITAFAAFGAFTAFILKPAFVYSLMSWIRKVFEKEEGSAKKTNSNPSLEREAADAAKAAAAAAADVARASHEMLISKTEEKKYLKELMNLIEVHVHEMKSMSNSIQKLEGQGNNTSGRNPLVEQDHRNFKFFRDLHHRLQL